MLTHLVVLVLLMMSIVIDSHIGYHLHCCEYCHVCCYHHSYDDILLFFLFWSYQHSGYVSGTAAGIRTTMMIMAAMSVAISTTIIRMKAASLSSKTCCF